MTHWICKQFHELTVEQLYAILQLRNEVFVVEQTCAYQDADNKDQIAWHLMGWKENLLQAYTRIIPPEVSYTEPSIGRVVTSPAVRGTGVGKELMDRSIRQVYELFGKTSIQIGAQVYLQKFYEELGFQQTGEKYIEDGIDHVHMIKP